MKRRTQIGVLSVTAAVTVSLLFAASAVAIQPPTGPTSIAIRTFDIAGDATGAAQYPVPSIQPNPTNWWGRRAAVGVSSTYGLWCGQTGDYNTWPKYPTRTSGRYDIVLPELAEYYESTASFWYKYPSRGDADSPAFVFHWFEGSVSGMIVDYRIIEGLTSTGVTREYSLTDTDNTINLSRKAGGLRWRFTDRAEAPASYYEDGTPIYVPVKTGMGVILDDLKVEGYNFGPVRSLSSAAAATGVELSWDRPYKATGSTATEERDIEYRIWRRPQSALPTVLWTELAASPLSDASPSVTLLDESATQGISYDYLVEPFAIGSTTSYGRAESIPGRFSAPGVDVSVDVEAEEIKSGDPVTFTYTVTNTGVSDLTDIVLADYWGDPWGAPISLASMESTDVLRTEPITTSKLYSVTVTADGGALENTATQYITVLHPAISVSAAPATRNANSSKHADFSITVSNTSNDARLTNVKVTLDGSVYNAGTLEPLASTVLLASPKVTKSKNLTLSATGTFLPDQTIATGVTSVAVALEPSRIMGSNRIATSIAAARRLYPVGILSSNVDGRRAVVIATGFGFPDALSAGSLAGAAGGPLLLVNKNDATPTLLAYVKNELRANYAYVVGGTSVVSEGVVAQLEGAGLTVRRIAGSNRYATSRDVANEVKRIQIAKGDPIDTVFLATGLNFPDALAASSLSAAMAAPVLLTEPESLPGDTAQALASIKPGRVIVCGGITVVSKTVSSGIHRNASYGSPVVTRMPGENRYATAKLIIDWGLSQGLGSPSGIDGVFLATATDYPDALAGGALAGGADGKWRPLMLTSKDTLASEASTLISQNDHVSFVSVIGGATVVTDKVRLQAQALFD